MSREDVNKLKQKCSKHRGKFNPNPETPDDYWQMSFLDELEDKKLAKKRKEAEERPPPAPADKTDESPQSDGAPPWW